MTDNPSLSQITFLEKLNIGKVSTIYKVKFQEKLCVLKVYHGEKDFHIPDRETNWFRCEAAAYRRLKQTGLCQKGIVPDFYGTITDIQPRLWLQLEHFHFDKYPTNAVLMEFVPNMRHIHLGNATEAVMERLREILVEMHRVRVLHDDVHPRNVAVCLGGGGEERMLWMDFGRAQTYPLDEPLGDKVEGRFVQEVGYFEWYMQPPEMEGELEEWKKDMTVFGG